VGASSIGGVWKIAIFGQYLALSRKWYQVEPWLLWDANRKPYPSFRSFNDLVRVTLKHLAKSSVTRSIARRLCDSCATCLCLRQSRLAEGIMFSTCTSVTNHENTIFWIRINRFFSANCHWHGWSTLQENETANFWDLDSRDLVRKIFIKTRVTARHWTLITSQKWTGFSGT